MLNKIQDGQKYVKEARILISMDYIFNSFKLAPIIVKQILMEKYEVLQLSV